MPSQTHGEAGNILHIDVVAGGLTEKDYRAATKTRVGPKTVAQVKANIRKTEALIKEGKLSPNKRKETRK